MQRKPSVLILIVNHIEKVIQWTGIFAAGLSLAIVVSTIFVVIAKNYFYDSHFYGQNSIKLSELAIYLFAIMFMTGIAETFRQDQHVRVDVFYRKLSAKKQALVNFFGTLVLLFPVCLVILFYSSTYVFNTWNETAKNTGGIPFVYILKAFLLVMPVLLMLQGLASLIRNAQIAFFRNQG